MGHREDDSQEFRAGGAGPASIRRLVAGTVVVLTLAALVATPAGATVPEGFDLVPLSEAPQGLVESGRALFREGPLPPPADDTGAASDEAVGSRALSLRTWLDDDWPAAWIADVETTLIGDADGDGYHGGFAVSIDVDTDAAYLDVYARLYLQPANAALELLHTSSDFRIRGYSAIDRWYLEFALTEDWPTEGYDLVIEILDSRDGRPLDTVGPFEDHRLAWLPLESEGYGHAPAGPHVIPADDGFVAAGYAGAAGGLLPILPLAIFFRRLGARRQGRLHCARTDRRTPDGRRRH